MKLIKYLAIMIFLYSCSNMNIKGVLNNTIQASIIDMKVDTFNHYTHVLYLSDGTYGAIDTYMRHDFSLYEYAKIGDSIVKRKGEYSLFVYKKSGKVKEFKYMDSNGNIYDNNEKL